MPESTRGDAEGSRRVFPIPEARALEDAELFPATRAALWELLGDLHAAVEASANRPEHEMLSTSFLVSGDRGYGKTTIFLTAAAALEDAEEYAAKCEPQEAELLGKLAGRVAWLETLDLEPVPKGANLLAAVLVRIRDALETATSHPAGRESFEPMGGHLEKTWEQLDRLVQDATFMWEETTRMNDPRRERAQQQIKAAEIFASFQQSFRATIERVASTLSRFTPRREPVLVLPVDNADRSIEHIYNIVKLCRLASSPRLWFVLAASRPDFQQFLERSFQQEMSSGAGLELDDHEHDRSVARRQASTTMRRAIPRGHQIQIDPVDAETAWSTKHDGYAQLHGLLGRVRLPVKVEQRPMPAGEPPTLLCLFDIKRRVDGAVEETYRRAYRQSGCPEGAELRPSDALLTHGARMALLNLSPRALRDLKRSIDSALEVTALASTTPSACEAGKEGQAQAKVGCEEGVRILVDQLRGALDESILPFWASEQLHNQILRRNMHGNLVLDLRGSPVGQLKQTHLSHVMRFGPERPAGAHRPPDVVFSDVHLRKFDDIVLELRDRDQPERRVPLPANVAGWFMLLHDFLKTFPTPRVISGGVTAQVSVLNPELIVTRHELAVNGEPVWLEFGWTLPEWDTFLDFSRFTIQWRAFLHHLEVPHSPDRPSTAERLRLVRAAWVENVCSVCCQGGEAWRWTPLNLALEKGGEEITRYEESVGAQVKDLIRRCDAAEQGCGSELDQPIDRSRLSRTGEWLRRSLPVLLNIEQSVGVEQHLVDGAVIDAADIGLDRRELVREAGMRSAAYRALVERDRRAALDPWLRAVAEAWFAPWERRHMDRRRNGALSHVDRRADDGRAAAPDAARGSGPSPRHH